MNSVESVNRNFDKITSGSGQNVLTKEDVVSKIENIKNYLNYFHHSDMEALSEEILKISSNEISFDLQSYKNKLETSRDQLDKILFFWPLISNFKPTGNYN